MPCQITPQFLQEIDRAIDAYWRGREIVTQQEQAAYLRSKHLKSFALRIETYETIYKNATPPLSEDKLIDAIDLIDYELKHWSGSSYVINDHRDINSPRIQFLLQKREKLIKIKENILAQKQSQISISTEELSGEKRSIIRIGFDIFKKIADSLDDIWQMIASAFNNTLLREVVSSFLQGIVGIIIFTAEAYQGLMEAHKAIAYEHSTAIQHLINRNNETFKPRLNQRKTRAATGLLICALGLTGAGLSAAFLASAFGAAVSGVALFPILLPLFLTSIYLVKLGKTSYILNQTTKQETNEREKLLAAKAKLETLSKKENPTAKDDAAFYEAQENLLLQKQDYLFTRSERLQAERQVAFKAIEVGTTFIVLTGVFMALAVAAGIASFGIAPPIIIAAGVLLAFSAQIFDYYDERKKNSPTKEIRADFINSWEKMTHTMRKTFKPTTNEISMEMKITPQENPASTPEPSFVPDIAIIRNKQTLRRKSF